MKYLLLLCILLLALGGSWAYPLMGSNEEMDCVVFDAFKNGIAPGEGDNTSQEMLYLDVGLTGSFNVTFRILDTTDVEHAMDFNKSRALQPGRLILAFPLPKETDVKALLVVPAEGKAFQVPWGEVPRYSNGVANLRYFGIADWLLAPDVQIMTLDVMLSNNDSQKSLLMDPQNFTLVDQWGWRYEAEDSFTAVSLPPKTRMRSYLTFDGMSPRSRPVVLAYDGGQYGPIFILLDDSMAGEVTEGNETGGTESSASGALASEPLPEVSGEAAQPTLISSQPSQPAQELLTTEDKVTAQRQLVSDVAKMFKGK